MKKLLLYIFIFAVIITLLPTNHSFAAETRLIKVGAFDSFPLIFKDTDGTIKGFYVDLLTEVGAKESISFEYVFGTWNDSLERIKSGEIDLLPGAGYLEERTIYIDYGKNPLLTIWGDLYVLDSTKISGILEVSGKKIAVAKGDIITKNFRELVSKFDMTCQFVELATYDDVFKAVAEKKVDAGIADVTYGNAKLGEFGLRSTGVVFNPLNYYFTATKGRNQDLLLLLDKYLVDWKNQKKSVLNQAKIKWLHGPSVTVEVIPRWLINALIIFGVLILVAFSFIVLLRQQVKKATNKILQRERALRESEERYRSLVEKANEGILIAQDGNIAYANHKTGSILNVPVDELKGKAFVDFIHPEDKNLVFERYKKRLAGENIPDAYEFRVINKMGEIRWLHLSARKLQWNERPATLNMVTDITERKQAEESLRRKEHDLRESQRIAHVGSWRLDVATNQVVWTEELYNMYGFDPSLPPPHYTEHMKLFTPESWDRLSTALDSIMDTGIPYSLELETVRKDGSNGWMWVRGEADVDSAGKTVGLWGAAQDITERKNAEESLRLSEELYRFALELTGQIVWSTPPDGSVEDMPSWRQYCGLSVEDIKGYKWLDTVHPDDREMVKKAWTSNVQKQERYYSNEYRVRRADGVYRHFMVRSMPLLNADGSIREWIGTHIDITERKLAEEEKKALEERLSRAEKMESLGLLAGGVAHDLNNVLGIVVGYAELLLDSVDEKSPLRKDLKTIFDGGQKAAAIVEDLLTLARRGVVGKKVLNLNRLITNFKESPQWSKLLTYHPQIQIKTELDPDLLNISASSVHLEKTLYNLVSNAGEAMTKGGTITIKTSNQYVDKPISGYDNIYEGDYVVLSVSDEGDGISETDLKRIFEPFYTKKIMGRSGTGLGLSVVWGTVKDHHGYIDVQSEEGRGTTFTLYFLITREEIEQEGLAVSTSEYQGNGQSLLVVDDVKDQRDLATRLLTSLNYQVSSVESGEEAIKYLKDHQPDLIVLDMIMDPGMDGLDTYKSVLEINPKQKAIIVSGFSESDRVKEAKTIGAGAYIKKPYIKEKLGLAVKKELERK